jgi:hypothetical protein
MMVSGTREEDSYLRKVDSRSLTGIRFTEFYR